MYVFLDESGDCGFKFDKGSSPYFIVGLVIVDDPELIRDRVIDYRKRSGLPERFEFKFYNMKNRHRIAFLKFTGTLPVRVRLMAIDKRLVTRPQLQNRETFYGHLLGLMLENSFDAIRGATLIIDESDKSKNNQQTLKSYIKRHSRDHDMSSRIKDVRHADSKSHEAIQIADVIVGAATRKYRDADNSFLDLVRTRIEDEWTWQPFSNE